MGLKSYTLRLDEEVYDGLRKALSEYGDPDLNISFVLRRYLRDLYEALPYLRKSQFNVLNTLAVWGTMLRNFRNIAGLEGLLKGMPIVERAQAEADNREEYWKRKKAEKKKEEKK